MIMFYIFLVVLTEVSVWTINTFIPFLSYARIKNEFYSGLIISFFRIGNLISCLVIKYFNFNSTKVQLLIFTTKI